MPSNTTVLRFDDLDQYLLLKNGNILYKIPYRDGWAVLKVYYGSRSRLGYIYKTLVHVCFANLTSVMPKARRRVESECLALWRDCGFRVFGSHDDVKIEGLPDGGYALFEYVPGTLFETYFSDPKNSLDEKLAMWRRFLPDWHRRHQLAIARRQPRLVHENGSLEHVMIHENELLYFDFEMVFRSRRRVREFVAREIISYVRSLGRCVGEEQWDIFLKETVEHYPDRTLLEHGYRWACENSNPLRRTVIELLQLAKAKKSKPFSTYKSARRLGEILEATQ